MPTALIQEGLVFFDAEQAPFQIYDVFREGGKFRRLLEAVANVTSAGVWILRVNTAGGRERFMADILSVVSN